jgi:hypothetical protein
MLLEPWYEILEGRRVNDVNGSKEHPYLNSGVAFVLLEKLTNPQRVVL